MTLPHPLVVPLECDDVTEIATVCQHIHWGKVDDWHFSERTVLGRLKYLVPAIAHTAKYFRPQQYPRVSKKSIRTTKPATEVAPVP